MTLLAVRDLQVAFAVRGPLLRRTVGHVHAVRGIGFDIERGETLALVGESGSGKSTAARAMAQLIRPTAGAVRFRGVDLVALEGRGLREARRGFQFVFQDPYSSLNRRWRVGEIVAEPLRVHRVARDADLRDAVDQLLTQVGLDPSYRQRFPHELSGGQRQRVGIARALALRPELIVCDEPISALDVSVQAQILNLLARLRSELQLTYLFITHDLGVVRRFADRVAVMHAGRIVELCNVQALFANPLHPYSAALLSAAPRLDGGGDPATRVHLQGGPPSPLTSPPGCLFARRCAFVEPACRERVPALADHPGNRAVACHRVDRGQRSWHSARRVDASESLGPSQYRGAAST